ncbi:MAG: GntR family transcriptional regulator [Desulfobacterales bacterium]|nr:GntR family transcriptional regulator [Desulfobacterales bacterium]MCP4161108.1 GntR family transcriptional regulator [Deltaproteobacteria bacterium]
MQKPIKPAEFVENSLITDIISGVYPKNSKLPGERVLAEKTGVTRPTLREALQRLSRDGWVTINHGKSTIVNDFWEKGGLGILRTLIKYIDLMPDNLLSSMLEFRTILFPEIAELAYKRKPEAIINYLDGFKQIDDPEKFSEFDWNLQLEMARCSQNPLFPLIVNDFTTPFNHLAKIYFRYKKARDVSSIYYKTIRDAFTEKDSDVKNIVREVMINSNLIWDELV